MNLPRLFSPVIGALIFTLACALRAGEPPASPPPPASPDATPALRRLDTDPAAEPAKSSPATAVEPAAPADNSPAAAPRRSRIGRALLKNQTSDDRVIFLDDNFVRKDLVVEGDAVGILGDLRIDGEVKGDAYAILGDVTINGTVNGGVGSVLGDITLGPNARVGGDVVNYGGGEVHRRAGSVVGGRVEHRDFDRQHLPPELFSWWTHALKLGRPLAIGPSLGWLWTLTALAIGFYALLALVFPTAIRKCGDTLAQRPGITVLTALLGILSFPLLIVLLVITVVGILVIPFLPVAFVLTVLFGKAAICALIGRAISRDQLHPALAVIVGGAVLVLFYLIPVAGIALSVLTGWLGFGCVVCTLLTPAPKPIAATPPPAASVPPPAAEPSLPLRAETPMATHTVPPTAPDQSPGFGSTSAPGNDPGPAPGFPPPPVTSFTPVPPVVNVATSSATLPRAGFFIRLGALLIDLILVAMICGPTGVGQLVPLVLAIYAAAMWQTKGTTIGGMICNLRVVRLDDRPVDWSTAIVRALGCFLSLAVGCLGFIWVAFDERRQSWHDKIAGTTVVHVPKGVSLV